MADQKITALAATTTLLTTDIIPVVTDPGGSPATKKITLTNILAALRLISTTPDDTGWVSASESWTYASATTITVPTGAASKYSIGDPIKWTQTTVKYAYIAAVADTLLTIAAGSDFSVANAAISANYFSKGKTPVGFPQWFNWTPTYTGFSANPTITCRFMLVGRKVTAVGFATGVGTSDQTFFTISAPITSANIVFTWGAPMWQTVDVGTAQTTPGLITIGQASATFNLYKNMASGVWTNSGNKYASFTTEYEI